MRVLSIFGILIASATVFAGNIETVIAPLAGMPQSGQQAEFSV
jgi:hypothetical protein